VVGRGPPSAITIHGYLHVINALPGHNSRLKAQFLVPEERRALRQADRVVAINGYMRDRFVNEAGCDPARTHIIANAINPVFLQEAVPTPRDIDLILVGTLHPLKNQNLALQLLAQLAQRQGLRPRVVVVGTATAESASYAAALQAYAQAQGLAHVSFVGRQTPAELAALYCRSRFLLHLSSFETDSSVVAEAALCGAVPIVNPVAALKHGVNEGRSGWHLPIDPLEGAAERLGQLLSPTLAQEAERAVMARAARADVVAERQPAAVARATVAMYRELLRGQAVVAGTPQLGEGH
jgi:D-inositol-3-phosphate glycosyltransferase